jgi:septin family protein
MQEGRHVYLPLEVNAQVTNTTIKRYSNIFAVVCALTNERVYPWGTLKIDDMTHSDFRLLQILLFEQGIYIYFSSSD